MRGSNYTRLWQRVIRPVGLSLAIVVIGMAAAWLSTRIALVTDWSVTGRGELSPATLQVLQTLSEPVHLTAFVREEPVVRRMISQLVERYRRVYAPITLNFVDPVRAAPQLAAVPGASEGMVLLVYGSRRQLINGFSEQRLSSGLLQIQRAENRFLLFVTGHGERDPNGSAARDISALVRSLRLQGVQAQSLNLAQIGVIPDNTAALVIASPQVRLLPQEVVLIRRYVEQGGNLFWTVEPGASAGLESLAQDLGVRFTVEPLRDARARTVPGANESTVLGFRYGNPGVTQDFDLVTAFADAAGVMASAHGYRVTPLVEWGGETQGRELATQEVMLAVTLERDVVVAGTVREQRLVVAGDGDFLSNAYLATGGNLELAMRVINWVQRDDVAVTVPASVAADARLQLSTALLMVLGVGFLLVLPVTLGALGVLIWWRRCRVA